MTTQQTNKQLLCKLMERDELWYETMVMDCAEEYLRAVLNMDEIGMQKMLYSTFFWKWWTAQWDRRNRMLIVECRLDAIYWILSPEQLRSLREFYEYWHNAKDLTIYPNRVIMELIYAQK